MVQLDERPFEGGNMFAACTHRDGRPKRAWRTEGAAFVVAQRVSKNNRDGHVKPYRCPDCGNWHVGHASDKWKDANMSTKGEILKHLGQQASPDALELTERLKRDGIATNQRTVVMLVWDLQKQGLAAFDERQKGQLSRIHLTPRGIEVANNKEATVPLKNHETIVAGSIPDRLEKAILAAGPDRHWKVSELVEELELKQQYAKQAVLNALNRHQRFAQDDKGWTLRIWRKQQDTKPDVAEPDHHLGVGHGKESVGFGTNTRNGLVAPGGPVERIPGPEKPVEHEVDIDRQPVMAVVHGGNGQNPPNQNEKPQALEAPAPNGFDAEQDPLAGLALVKNVIARFEKRRSMMEAARILEAAGEDDLAIQTLAKVELTALEDEVVELVRRTVGEAVNAPREVHSGHA